MRSVAFLRNITFGSSLNIRNGRRICVGKSCWMARLATCTSPLSSTSLLDSAVFLKYVYNWLSKSITAHSKLSLFPPLILGRAVDGPKEETGVSCLVLHMPHASALATQSMEGKGGTTRSLTLKCAMSVVLHQQNPQTLTFTLNNPKEYHYMVCLGCSQRPIKYSQLFLYSNA